MPTHDDTSDAAKLLANLYVHHCTVVEWFDLLKRQIERAQKYAPDLDGAAWRTGTGSTIAGHERNPQGNRKQAKGHR